MEADDDRAALEAAGLVRVEGPGDGKIGDVAAIDLRERGVMAVSGSAAVGGPGLVCGGGGSDGGLRDRRGEERSRER